MSTGAPFERLAKIRLCEGTYYSAQGRKICIDAYWLGVPIGEAAGAVLHELGHHRREIEGLRPATGPEAERWANLFAAHWLERIGEYAGAERWRTAPTG